MSDNSKVLFVVGMHRSGTSAVAGVCHALGFDAGKSLMPPKPDNPQGFWENQLVVNAHERLLCEFGLDWDSTDGLPADWQTHPIVSKTRMELIHIIQSDFLPKENWLIKDPRLCLLLPLYNEVLRAIGRKASVLLVLRNPCEVSASLKTRDQMTELRAVQLYQQYLTSALDASQRYERLAITYDRVIELGDELKDVLGVALCSKAPSPRSSESEQKDSLIDRSLRHNLADRDDSSISRAYTAVTHGAAQFISEDALGTFRQSLNSTFDAHIVDLANKQDLESLKLENDSLRNRAIIYKENYLRLEDELALVHSGYGKLLEDKIKRAAKFALNPRLYVKKLREKYALKRKS